MLKGTLTKTEKKLLDIIANLTEDEIKELPTADLEIAVRDYKDMLEKVADSE